MNQLRVLNLWVKSMLEDEEGQTLAEYALILALIAAVVVGVVAILGGNISSIFSSASSAI